MSLSTVDLVAGGYVLSVPVTREGSMSADLLPRAFPSASECLADFAPGTWGLAWATNEDAELRRVHHVFGLSDDRAEEFSAFSTQTFEKIWGWPHVIYDRHEASAVACRFLSQCHDIKLLGIALPHDLVSDFLDYATPDPPRPGFAPEGETGFVTALRRGLPIAAGGTPLGWEVLGFDVSSFHSWICNGLESQVAGALRIHPNENGLITEPHEARAAAEFCGGPNARAEPALWLPWLLTEYPLEHRSSGAV